MKIEIYNCGGARSEYFKFDLWDGPDGADHVSGFAVDLIEAFTKILEWRERIAADYSGATDYQAGSQSVGENETL